MYEFTRYPLWYESQTPPLPPSKKSKFYRPELVSLAYFRKTYLSHVGDEYFADFAHHQYILEAYLDWRDRKPFLPCYIQADSDWSDEESFEDEPLPAPQEQYYPSEPPLEIQTEESPPEPPCEIQVDESPAQETLPEERSSEILPVAVEIENLLTSLRKTFKKTRIERIKVEEGEKVLLTGGLLVDHSLEDQDWIDDISIHDPGGGEA